MYNIRQIQRAPLSTPKKIGEPYMGDNTSPMTAAAQAAHTAAAAQLNATAPFPTMVVTPAEMAGSVSMGMFNTYGMNDRVGITSISRTISNSATGYPLHDIDHPGLNDVMCGRGGGTNNHVGNVRFRQLVNGHKLRYLAASKIEKPIVAREVVQIWRNLHPPGRFLAQEKDAGENGLWNDVGDKRAKEKASQCLRERTPDVMPFVRQLEQQQREADERERVATEERKAKKKKSRRTSTVKKGNDFLSEVNNNDIKTSSHCVSENIIQRGQSRPAAVGSVKEGASQHNQSNTSNTVVINPSHVSEPTLSSRRRMNVTTPQPVQSSSQRQPNHYSTFRPDMNTSPRHHHSSNWGSFVQSTRGMNLLTNTPQRSSTITISTKKILASTPPTYEAKKTAAIINSALAVQARAQQEQKQKLYHCQQQLPNTPRLSPEPSLLGDQAARNGENVIIPQKKKRRTHYDCIDTLRDILIPSLPSSDSFADFKNSKRSDHNILPKTNSNCSAGRKRNYDSEGGKTRTMEEYQRSVDDFLLQASDKGCKPGDAKTEINKKKKSQLKKSDSLSWDPNESPDLAPNEEWVQNFHAIDDTLDESEDSLLTEDLMTKDGLDLFREELDNVMKNKENEKKQGGIEKTFESSTVEDLSSSHRQGENLCEPIPLMLSPSDTTRNFPDVCSLLLDDEDNLEISSKNVE